MLRLGACTQGRLGCLRAQVLILLTTSPRPCLGVPYFQEACFRHALACCSTAHCLWCLRRTRKGRGRLGRSAYSSEQFVYCSGWHIVACIKPNDAVTRCWEPEQLAPACAEHLRCAAFTAWTAAAAAARSSQSPAGGRGGCVNSPRWRTRCMCDHTACLNPTQPTMCSA